MRTQQFIYESQDGTKKDKEVYVLNSGTDFLVGIDVNVLTENEKETLTTLVDQFEENLKPFIKRAFRRFTSSKITYPEKID